jgi:spermidine/putrescine transport system substrate-binding protein
MDTRVRTTDHLLDGPISRRRLLQVSGAAGAAAFLAATGASGSRAASRPASAARSQRANQESPGGAFRMATWIGYMNTSEDGTSYPSLERFTQETGIEIDYQEAVDTNDSFFATDLQGPISAGVETGWDIVVLTDWMVQRLVNLGWLDTWDPTAMPNYPANLVDLYTSREWDPGNLYAAPYVSGMTGLGFDKLKTGEQTNLDILFSDEFAGRMTYLDDLRDTIGLAALRQGTVPETITQEQFDAALVDVQGSVDSGRVRGILGNSYVEEMVNGDVVLAIAWSGDVATLLIPDQAADRDFQWRLADQGGMLWSDNMVIPKGAQNVAQAQVFVNWYYDPANAAEIDSAVSYVSPVKGSLEAMQAINPDLAADPLAFPTPEMQQRLHQFRSLDPDTATAWEGAFNSVAGR